MRRVLLCGLTALVSGCPLLDVRAEVEEVCMTYRGVTIPGMAAGATSVEQSFDFDDLRGAKQLADAGATLVFTRAELRATSGPTSFELVHHATLSIASADPASTLPTLDVFTCDDCGNATPTLQITNASTTPVDDYLETGGLVVTVDLAGTLPTADWTADIDVCMTGTIAYQLSR
jgi:hypothetical protein